MKNNKQTQLNNKRADNLLHLILKYFTFDYSIVLYIYIYTFYSEWGFVCVPVLCSYLGCVFLCLLMSRSLENEKKWRTTEGRQGVRETGRQGGRERGREEGLD